MNEVEQAVGGHYANGKQCHVPLDVLDALDVEPGDKLEFAVYENGCIITVRE